MEVRVSSGSRLRFAAAAAQASSHTALFADLIQNFPRDWFKGWRGFLARHGGIVAPNPGAPCDWRASLLIAHGDLPTGDGVAFVRRAFTWLLGHEVAA
jgi:hypothetical protein